MPRTSESILENHRVAIERRTAGKPIWDRKLRIKHLLSAEESDAHAQQTAAVIKGSTWMKASAAGTGESDEDLQLLVDELETVQNLADLNELLDQMYDLADADRVWVC